MNKLSFEKWFYWFRRESKIIRGHKNNVSPKQTLKELRAIENNVCNWYNLKPDEELSKDIIKNVFSGYHPFLDKKEPCGSIIILNKFDRFIALRIAVLEVLSYDTIDYIKESIRFSKSDIHKQKNKEMLKDINMTEKQRLRHRKMGNNIKSGYFCNKYQEKLSKKFPHSPLTPTKKCIKENKSE